MCASMSVSLAAGRSFCVERQHTAIEDPGAALRSSPFQIARYDAI